MIQVWTIRLIETVSVDEHHVVDVGRGRVRRVNAFVVPVNRMVGIR